MVETISHKIRTITRRSFVGSAAAGAALLSAGVPLRTIRAATPLKVGVLLPRSGHLALIGQVVFRHGTASFDHHTVSQQFRFSEILPILVEQTRI